MLSAEQQAVYDARVQHEMDVVGLRYLKVLAFAFGIYYLFRGISYLNQFDPAVAPYLGWPALGSAFYALVLLWRIMQDKVNPAIVNGAVITLYALLDFNVFWNLYLTGNTVQFFNAGSTVVAIGLGTMVFWIWSVSMVLTLLCFTVALNVYTVDLVDHVSFMGGCTVLSAVAFFSRAPLIRERVKLQLKLEQKAETLQAANHAKDRFLANMTHELRTPMTGVLGMVDLLRETRLSREQEKLLNTAKTSAGYLLAIINDILDYSKLESGKFELTPAPMEAVAVTRDVVEMLRGQAEGKQISVTVHAPTDTEAWVLGDSVRIGQVLFNLVGNAIKFTERGGVDVYLDVAVGDGVTNLEWRVVDTGAGIPQERIPGLFERFEQLDDTATRRQTGTGLGLAIIKELVGLMRGNIGVTSVIGDGSEFRVSLTLPTEVAGAQNEASGDAPTGPAARAVFDRPLRVLVAEDNQINQMLIDKILSKEGWDLVFTENGEAAVAAATKSQERFDIVLMDVRMPVMDGPSATRIIKTKMRNPPPIIALTANTMKADVDAYLEAGMDAHVGKPINVDELMATIKETLGRDNPSDRVNALGCDNTEGDAATRGE